MKQFECKLIDESPRVQCVHYSLIGKTETGA